MGKFLLSLLPAMGFVSCSDVLTSDSSSPGPFRVRDAGSAKMAAPPKGYPFLASAIRKCKEPSENRNTGKVKVSSSGGSRTVLRIYGTNETLSRGTSALIQTGIPGPAVLEKHSHSGRNHWKALNVEGCREYDFISLQCRARADSSSDINCLPEGADIFLIKSQPQGEAGGRRRNRSMPARGTNNATLSKGAVRILDGGRGGSILLEFTPDGKSSPCRWNMEYRCAQ